MIVITKYFPISVITKTEGINPVQTKTQATTMAIIIVNKNLITALYSKNADTKTQSAQIEYNKEKKFKCSIYSLLPSYPSIEI